MGRQHRAQGRKQEEYEAYRLLGTAVCSFLHYPFHDLADVRDHSCIRWKISLHIRTSASYHLLRWVIMMYLFM
jgi:hypothetical protein